MAVIGVALSVAASEYQSERDNRRRLQEASDALLRDLLRETVESFHAAKQGRRLLRANRAPTPSGAGIDLLALDVHMSSISDAQLKFERLEVVAELIQDPRVDAQTLADCFHTIEKSLSRVITEYEDARLRHGSTSTIALKDLPELDRFIDPMRKAEMWHPRIAWCIRGVVRHLQAALREVVGRAEGDAPPADLKIIPRNPTMLECDEEGPRFMAARGRSRARSGP